MKTTVAPPPPPMVTWSGQTLTNLLKPLQCVTHRGAAADRHTLFGSTLDDSLHTGAEGAVD